MSSKLTLTIEGAIIKKAKLYASKEERSLSDLIENYLKALTTEELKGSFKLPAHFDYKKEVTDRLSEKYLS
jgi:hypothetical protein